MGRSPASAPRPLAAAATLATCLAAAPAASAADTVTLDVPARAVEDQPVRIVARGEAEPDRRLFVYTEPGGTGCAPTPAEQKLRPAAVEHTYRYVSPPDYLDVVTGVRGARHGARLRLPRPRARRAARRRRRLPADAVPAAGLRGSVRVCAYAAEAQDAAPDARRSLRLRAR